MSNSSTMTPRRPAADVTAIVAKMKDKFREQSDSIRKTFRSIDKDHSGLLDMNEFKQVLKKFNLNLTDQEVISVLRKFDPNGDGSVRYAEFCANVLEDDYKQVEEAAPQPIDGSQSARLPPRRAYLQAQELTRSLGAKPISARLPPLNYTALGEYRPPAPASKHHVPENLSDAEFHKMLAMVGEKIGQRFSKAREVFRFVDSDHSGTVSKNEVRYFFRFFNVQPEEADKFFDGFTKDDNGEIEYGEFLSYLWPHINPGNEQEPWRLRNMQPSHAVEYQQGIQTSLTGQLGNSSAADLPSDLRRARVNITQRLHLKYKHKSHAFRSLDTNGDGTITLEEMKFFFDNFGWGDLTERFYNVLLKDGHGTIEYDTFMGLFDDSTDIAALRFR